MFIFIHMFINLRITYIYMFHNVNFTLIYVYDIIVYIYTYIYIHIYIYMYIYIYIHTYIVQNKSRKNFKVGRPRKAFPYTQNEQYVQIAIFTSNFPAYEAAYSFKGSI